MATTLTEAEKPAEDVLKAAAQQLEDEKKPDRVLPVDALPDIVKRAEDMLPDTDKQPDEQATERALEKLSRDERESTPVPEAGKAENPPTTELRNIEREIIKGSVALAKVSQ